MTTTDNLQAVINTATRAVSPSELEPGKIYGWLTADGRVQQIDLSGDEHRAAPARKTGNVTLRDTFSFLAYYGKHADENTEVYADAETLTITAVLDAHGPDRPRFGRHRAVLSLRTTRAWEEWNASSGRLMDQDAFANFLEDHLPELVAPDAATMLEIAQSIQATTSATFQSSTRLHSGERKFAFAEDTTAKAGSRGELTIPETFTVGLKPFEGSDGFTLTARFRYRLGGGTLQLGYKLERPEDVRQTAFDDVLQEVTDAVTTPVMNGSPARA
ncbi:DUF2303 family protein [Kitasatospora sp. McL0602]|uniref:DUF2303 family protein n=1 Tax=Kitasatospora sp. McL0602 TaxID=3439530 RepID=UPI003F8AA91B